MTIAKKTVGLVCTGFMLLSCMAGCGGDQASSSAPSSETSSISTTESTAGAETSLIGDETTTAASETQVTGKGESTKKGDKVTNTVTTTTKKGTPGGWKPNTQKNLTPEQLDVAFPLRKNVKGTIRAFSPFADTELFVNAKKAFEKAYPGTKVELIGGSNVSRNEKLMALIKSQDPPDYVYTIYCDYPLRAFKELTQPIDQYLQPHPAYSDFLMNNFATYNGKKYAAIIETPPTMLYYNTAMFQSKGEKTPEWYYKNGKWTWSTLRTLAKRMTDEKKEIYGFSTDIDNIFPLSVGQDVVKFVGGKPYMNIQNNQKYTKAYQFFLDMINKDKSAYKTRWEAHTKFGQGKVAMCYAGVASIEYAEQNYGFKTYKCVPFPRMDENSPYFGMVGGFCGGFSIGKGAKNVQGGMAFGEMVVNTALKMDGNMTNHKDIYNMSRECKMQYVGSWMDGYGLEGPINGFYNWARTGTKDLNTLINENVNIMDNCLKEYRK